MTAVNKKTWWEKFYEENKDKKELSEIFKTIEDADKELNKDIMYKIAKMVYSLDKDKYKNEIEKFLKKIDIFEKRMGRQVNDEFGSNIRKARKEKGWSVEKLSQESGISIAYLYKLETGDKKAPSYPIIETIANTLNISSIDLLRTESNDEYTISELILGNKIIYGKNGEKKKLMGSSERVGFYS